MTASLLSTLAVIFASVVIGEIACWLIFDNDQPDEEDTDETATD